MRRNKSKLRTSLLSNEGTGIAAEATGSEVDKDVLVMVGTDVAELLEDEATVVMEVGLPLRPGLLEDELWLLLPVGEGGCCFFFTACEQIHKAQVLFPCLQMFPLLGFTTTCKAVLVKWSHFTCWTESLRTSTEPQECTYLFVTDWAHAICGGIAIEATVGLAQGWWCLHVGFLFHLGRGPSLEKKVLTGKQKTHCHKSQGGVPGLLLPPVCALSPSLRQWASSENL